MTQHERAALDSISAKIAPKIRELVENKISENLKALHDETSLKLVNLTSMAKDSINKFYNSLLTDRDNLTKQIEEMKKTVEIAAENHNNIARNEKAFCKVRVLRVFDQFSDLYFFKLIFIYRCLLI